MKDKKTLYAFIILIIICGIVWFLFSLTQTGLKQKGQSTDVKKEIPKQPEIPKFLFGSVSKIEGRIVTLKVGNEEKEITVAGNTVIIKQVKDVTGYKSIPVIFSEIKSGAQMIVYYRVSSLPNYVADKIQILVTP